MPEIPQVVSIVRAAADGAVPIKKKVREHLGPGGVCLSTEGQGVRLARSPSARNASPSPEELLRAMPWTVRSPNRDGSWGQDGRGDAATYAELRAMCSAGVLVGRAGPQGFLRRHDGEQELRDVRQCRSEDDDR